MYGGHITDSWDRRTNETYLDFYYEDGIFKHKEIAPGFKAPDVNKLNYSGVLEYVEKKTSTGDTANVSDAPQC